MRRIGCVAALLVLCCGFEWPGRLPRLIYQSAHGTTLERDEAVRLLGHYPAEAVREALLLALEDEDLEVRLDAAAALGQARVPEAVPLLMEWLDAKLPELRTSAVQALGKIDDPRAHSALARALSDAQPAVRLAAVNGLAHPSREVIPQLMAALDDADSAVRVRVASLLGALDEPAAFTALANHARDEAPDVRGAALRALGQSRDARALPLLTQALNDSDENVRLAAIGGLGDLDSPAAVNVLRGCLRLPSAFAKTALAALARIRDDSAATLLVATLTHAELGPAAAVSLLERVRSAAAAGDDARAERVVTALANALVATPAGPYATLLADTLIELARVAPAQVATPVLSAALAGGRGDPHNLARVLAVQGGADVLPTLLESMAREGEPELEPLLDALAEYFARNPGDGRAVEPLLARLASTTTASVRLKLLALIGQTQAPRALPSLAALLATANPTEQLAVIDAIGQLHSDASRGALWPLLAAPAAEQSSRPMQTSEPRLRLTAARALAQSANLTLVRDLSAALASRSAGDPHAILVALTASLARIQPKDLDTKLRAELLATLARLIDSDDDALSARALAALRGLHDLRALPVIARSLRSPSGRRRSVAVAALADFPHEDTRRLLRFVLQHDGPRVAVAAALALGEVGDQRDAAALARTAQRTIWPLPAAATFGLVRMAQRGVSKRHSMQRHLCDLAGSRDAYVRANVAAGLATLGAPACDETSRPLAWLEPNHAPAVRVAAARWAHFVGGADTQGEPLRKQALAACAAELDPTLALACRSAPEPDPPSQRLDIEAYASDGQTLLRQQLVALRLPNASVFVGYTDPNGQLTLPAAHSGKTVLEDPSDVAREP